MISTSQYRTSTGDSRFQLSIHLRRLSDGSPHPSTAKTSALEHSLPITVARVSFMIVICAEYLGIMFISGGEGDNEIVIWNWKTGVIQMVCSGSLHFVDASLIFCIIEYNRRANTGIRFSHRSLRDRSFSHTRTDNPRGRGTFRITAKFDHSRFHDAARNTSDSQ